MNRSKKICVVTGTRAEYGLLYWLMKQIENDKELSLQVIVTGMHLSPEFGMTCTEVEKEFHVDKKIEILLSSDTAIGVSKSMGLAMISFGEALTELEPDLVILLGDRYEIFSVAAAAMVARIPIAHIHGGEITEGLIDEAIRHSITKMSYLHFVATEEYKKRVTQLGENPERIFNVGGLGIENIMKLKLLSRSEFEDSINYKLGKCNILITFHPVTLEKTTSKEQFSELLRALEQLKDTTFIFTKANSDTDGRVINQMIDNFAKENNDRAIAFASLGQLRYLSALQYMDAVVGNSSSGLIEAPSFKVATINIGDRQKGRIKADSVIDCEPNSKAILEAFSKAFSDQFKGKLQFIDNPYGEGSASEQIVKYLKAFNISDVKKTFFDLAVD